MFDSMCRSGPGDPLVELFGSDYSPPPVFRHGDWTLVVSLPKDQEDGDGHAVEVYESRCPAAFYRVVALPGVNSIGDEQEGFSLSTGTGQGRLVKGLADAITQGMIGVDREVS